MLTTNFYQIFFNHELWDVKIRFTVSLIVLFKILYTFWKYPDRSKKGQESTVCAVFCVADFFQAPLKSQVAESWPAAALSSI